MPILRCSKEFYDYVTKKAMETGNPSSIILDRMLVQQPVALNQLHLPLARVSDVEKPPKAKLIRCTMCGKMVKNMPAHDRKVHNLRAERTSRSGQP